jgi:hypothetical protein
LDFIDDRFIESPYECDRSLLVKWLLGTLLAVAVLTFTIARFVKVGG